MGQNRARQCDRIVIMVTGAVRASPPDRGNHIVDNPFLKGFGLRFVAAQNKGLQTGF
jgi:hypothetical protein